MLNVCVSATSTDGAISTSADLRLLLNTTSTANDAYQQSLVVRASQWVEGFLGYPILAQTYTETVSGFGVRNLMLSRTPIRVILGVFDSTSTDTATEYCSTNFRVEDYEAGFLSRPAGWAWNAEIGWGAGPIVMPGNESQPWMIRYVAGAVGPTGADPTTSPTYSTCGSLPNTTSTGTTVPTDFAQAAILKAAEWSQAPTAGVSAESVGDLSVSYFGSGDYRSEAENILRRYRR